MKYIFNKDYYRNPEKMKWKNDGFRSLLESVIHPDVLLTFMQWKENYNTDNCVLIGGLATQYYIKPRPTEDIDLIFMTYEDIPEYVYKFKKSRKHAFKNIKTHVEVEVLEPLSINKTKSFMDKVFKNSSIIDGVRVASPSSLIALKLGRFTDLDMGDISQLYEYCKENNIDIDNDILEYDLSDIELNNFNFVKNRHGGRKSDNMYMIELKSNFRDKIKFQIIKDEKIPYDIYIFKEEYGEPRFHYGKDILIQKRKYEHFQFSISLTESIINNKLKILESTTGYKSFNGFTNEEEVLKKWLFENKNLEKLICIWNDLNERKIKS